MELKQLFEKAVADSKLLPKKPATDILLQLYSLYKQATEGDINIDAPKNMFDFVAKAKFGAWEKLKGESKDKCMEDFIKLITKLQEV